MSLRLHVSRARRVPLSDDDDRDTVPVRLVHIAMALVVATGGFGAMWLFTWLCMELHKILH